MQSNIVITSDSNLCHVDVLDMFKPFDLMTIDVLDSSKNLFERNVIALGGGSVIDKAKLINKEKPIIAIPTTASGACMTSWAVVWKKDRKESHLCSQPIFCDIYKQMDIKLHSQVIDQTYYDCMGHILDSKESVNATSESLDLCSIAQFYLDKYLHHNFIHDLIEAGNYAGKAIEITGTNKLHAMSYILSIENGLPHGIALKQCILRSTGYDWDQIEEKAKKEYPKYYENIYENCNLRVSSS